MTDTLTRARQSLAHTAGTSLAHAVAQRRGKPWLLLDTSYSMSEGIHVDRDRPRRIDQLRIVVRDLGAAFTGRQICFGKEIVLTDAIEEPLGGTPLAQAIACAQDRGAQHLIIVSDGEPDDPEEALRVGRAFGGRIDTFFAGTEGSRGSQFLRALATQSQGGTYGATDLSDPLHLTAGIKGLLPASSEPGKTIAL